ncbi:MAG: efflux RND transporter periplasmic adaptor subunit [Myxococcales bacterium]|jgi:Cu(I)/Ag(I) efflux system membrane fusion protein
MTSRKNPEGPRTGRPAAEDAMNEEKRSHEEAALEAAQAPEVEAQREDEETGTPAPLGPPPKSVSLKLVAVVSGVALVAMVIGAKWGGRVGGELSAVWNALHDHDEAAERGAGATFYTCGMHPWVLLPKKGICPICQMELTPVDPAKFSGEVTIDPIVVQNIGVRVEPVVAGPLVQSVRTVGTVDYDETRVRAVNTKVAGWIEKLHADCVGAEVRRGQPLFSMYSPDLFAAQREYLLARKSGNESLIEAARTKLEYFDVTAEQIAALEARGGPTKTMVVRSPHSGIVTAKHAVEGMKVDPGMQAYQIADLSKVWVMVTLYEYQLPNVKVGQRATMTLSYLPGRSFEGRVIYVYPYLDKETRQANVRLEFDNPDALLKPGMFATVQLHGTVADERTLAPRAAVIDTGERQVAFVSRGDGKFEPRDVRMGLESSDGKVEILEGLEPGELVVTSGQFLIDSEAKMREALAKMIRGEMASEQAPVVAGAGEGGVKGMSEALAKSLGAALDAYLEVGDKLAADTTDGIGPLAKALAETLEAMQRLEVPGDPHFWHEHAEAGEARDRARELAGLKEMDAVRHKYASLSDALVKLVQATGVPSSYGKEIQRLHCPMFREDEGGVYWLQPAGTARNPYFGAMMLRCFDTREGVPVASVAGGGHAGHGSGGAGG